MVVNILQNLIPQIPMAKPTYNSPYSGGVDILPNPNSGGVNIRPNPRNEIFKEPEQPNKPSLNPNDYTFPNLPSPDPSYLNPTIITPNDEKPKTHDINPPPSYTLPMKPTPNIEPPTPSLPTPKNPDVNTTITQQQLNDLYDKLNKKFQDTLTNNKRDSDGNFTNISIQLEKAANDILKKQQENYKQMKDLYDSLNNNVNNNQNKNNDSFKDIQKTLENINFTNNQNYKSFTDNLNKFSFNQDKLSDSVDKLNNALNDFSKNTKNNFDLMNLNLKNLQTLQTDNFKTLQNQQTENFKKLLENNNKTLVSYPTSGSGGSSSTPIIKTSNNESGFSPLIIIALGFLVTNIK